MRLELQKLGRLIAALESMFLIRFIPSEGDFSKPVLFFEDLAEWTHLNPGATDHQKLFLSFIYQNLRTQFHYRPELKTAIFAYAEKSGYEVKLCFRSGQQLIGIIPVVDESTMLTAHKDARNFIKCYPTAKVLLVGLENKDLLLGHNVRYLCIGKLI